MTDREMLKLAAKAAGIDILGWCFPDYYSHRSGEVAYILGYDEWNPLTDDGDALRLAVGLRMAVSIDSPSCGPVGFVQVYTDREHVAIQEDIGSDTNAATRRAIVRAAAEIGSGMADG